MEPLESKVFWFIHPRTSGDLHRLKTMAEIHNSLPEPSLLVVLSWKCSEERIFRYLDSYQGKKPILNAYGHDSFTEEQMITAEQASSLNISDSYHFLGGVNGHNCISIFADLLLTGSSNFTFPPKTVDKPRARAGRVFAVNEFLRQSESNNPNHLYRDWESPVTVPIIAKRDIANPSQRSYPLITKMELALAHAYTNLDL